jgi:predicted nucleotidyltransferase component of viral defense system
MRIPLCLKIKRKYHKEIAAAQDVVVELLYSMFPQAVLHGGIAIWRCYSGTRFSEDLDVYISRDVERINRLFAALERRGFEIPKRRIKKNALYSALRMGRAEVRLEALFKLVKGTLREYETVDGNLLTVYALSPEDLLREKVEAYLTRRKVRDLYDVFFLLRLMPKTEETKSAVSRLLAKFRPPVDERELRAVILSGAVPSVSSMLEYMRRWVR